MKYLVLLALLVGCVSTTPKRFCYYWGDKQGVVHTTCKVSKDECYKDARERTKNYQTISDCDKR